MLKEPIVIGIETSTPATKCILVATPPSTQMISYYGRKFLLPIPNMLWCIRVSGSIRSITSSIKIHQVFFLKEAPKDEARLYRAIFPNVYRSGSVCIPSVKAKTISTIAQFVQAGITSFWGTPFNNDITHNANFHNSILDTFGEWEASGKNIWRINRRKNEIRPKITNDRGLVVPMNAYMAKQVLMTVGEWRKVHKVDTFEPVLLSDDYCHQPLFEEAFKYAELRKEKFRLAAAQKRAEKKAAAKEVVTVSSL